MAFLKFQAASPVALYVGAQEVVGIYYGAAQVWPLNPPLNAQVGTFALSGKAASLKVSRKLTAACGAFSLNGQAATLSRTRKLMADAGLFTLTGQVAEIIAGTPFLGEAGLFALTGQEAALKVSRKLVAQAGLFALTGQEANLVASSVAGYSFNMTAGVYGGFITGYYAGLAGSIDQEPLSEDFPLQVLATGLINGIAWPSDVISLVEGMTLWVDGVEYPFGSDWAYDPGEDLTSAYWDESFLPPSFVVDTTYFVEIK